MTSVPNMSLSCSGGIYLYVRMFKHTFIYIYVYIYDIYVYIYICLSLGGWWVLKPRNPFKQVLDDGSAMLDLNHPLAGKA